MSVDDYYLLINGGTFLQLLGPWSVSKRKEEESNLGMEMAEALKGTQNLASVK